MINKNKFDRKFPNNLFEYLNKDSMRDEDPLIKLAIAHYRFEAIHPFSDGNGKTGRIMNPINLVKTGLLIRKLVNIL